MNKFFKVFLYEYKKHVFTKRFIFALLSIPVSIVLLLGISIGAQFVTQNSDPVGYVDHSGLLANPVPPPAGGALFTSKVEIKPFASEETARASLDAGEIQGYYVISDTYFKDGSVKLVSSDEPDWRIQDRFEAFMRANLLTRQPPQIAARLKDGINFTVESPDGQRKMGQDDWFNIIIPMAAGLLFMIIIITTGGYLLQAVVEEKENRTMEMLVTSISPGQLMAGKTAGNLLVGVTQITIWILFIAGALAAARGRVEWVSQIHIDLKYVLILIGTMLPAFVLVGAIMAAIGATVTESREAQQISGFFSLPIFAPYWFISSIMEHPNGPLAQALSFFPLTSPVTLSLRAAFTTIPTEQLLLNFAVLILSAGVALWVAGRAFRLGMLSYGKRIRFKELFSRPQAG
jgi:ABC-2 type transport system permease protein